MNSIKNGIAGLLVFAVLIGLFMTYYDGVKTAYDIPADTQMVCGVLTNTTIGEEFKDLNIVASMQYIANIFSPDSIGNPLDLAGAILLSGLGFVLGTLSIFSTPFEIANIVECHYALPPGFLNGLLVIMCVYIVFILVRAKIKSEV